MSAGGDNKVSVSIGTFKPNIICDKNPTPDEDLDWNTCITIFEYMRTSRKSRVFGNSGDEGVEVELPTVLEAGKHPCLCLGT